MYDLYVCTVTISSVTMFDHVTLQVNTATMKVLVSIHGMRPAPRSVSAMQSSSAAVLAPGGGELVLPADNSLLQFWDAVRDCHVDRLQVFTPPSPTLSPPHTHIMWRIHVPCDDRVCASALQNNMTPLHVLPCTAPAL